MTELRLEGKKALVVGMAKSGVACVRLLAAKGANVRAADQKPAAEIPDVAAELDSLGVSLAPQAAESFDDVELVVLSPGVPADLPELEQARLRGVKVIGEVELASYFLKGRTIGVTGANGKTTTTSLIGHVLREAGVPVQVGGNIGTPVTAMIDSSRDEQWNVLELSSFQLETIERFRADIGVAVNVTPDHLDRHHTFENYAAAKARLFDTQRAGDYAVLNADDAVCVSYACRGRGAPFWFSLERAVKPGIYLDGGDLVCDGKPLMAASDIPLRGRHNIENTLASAGAALLAGVAPEAIAAAVRTFPGVEHRLEFVRTIAGVDFYNDSKATNVDATMKAIDAFPGGLWIILGGKDKGSDYTVMREALSRKARAVLLIGAASAKIESHLDGSVRLIRAGTLERAVRDAFSLAAPGDTVLLAPACASFDQFNSYEHRGKVFKELVAGLEARA